MAPKNMTTYVYETIPAKAGEKPRYFEFKQSMKDAPLSRHPESGEPIRRVISGGFGTMNLKSDKGASAPHRHTGPACGCGAGGCN